MSDGKLTKMEMDYSSHVDELIEKIKSKVESRDIDGALEDILSLEKQARMDSDAISTGRLLESMVQLLAESGEWTRLNKQLEAMCKKRNQLKQAVTKMVQKAMEYVDKTPDEEHKLALIDSLRTVTEGKIYVEVERARLTKELARIKEANQEIEVAAKVLQELQVETFGSMERREKVEFILEQMRLSLIREDYIRTQINSKKISAKFFKEESNEDLKLKFYTIMIQLCSHDNRYLDISKYYWEIMTTKSIQADEDQKLTALKHCVIYLCLASYDNEQHDLMCRRKTTKEMEKIKPYLEVLNLFTKNALIQWDEFCSTFENMLKTEVDVFSSEKYAEITTEKRWKDFHSRVIEHNIRVIADYYTRIRLSRMTSLLNLNTDETERYLSELVVNKTVIAKIDRLEGVVHFTESKAPVEMLEDWSRSTNNLMALINQTTHLINKERMIHGV